STPREEGAEMFVGRDAVSGTIGGGHLEYMAIDRARQMLARGETTASLDIPLGPEIGQCCGGRVELGFDRSPPSPPAPGRPVLIFGAGHVGRALAVALSPLPLSPRLIDTRADELALAEIRAAPAGAAYVILTHDHALDFMLAVEVLRRGDAGYAGMIGSRSKRATFLNHAAREGVDAQALVCPIATSFPRDKRPEVIAAFAAAEILSCLLAPSCAPVEMPTPAPSVLLVD
ncbi:MAG: xanthine dehydrogenase accessory protein XdhC, partial [Ancylobacter novellus]